MDIDAAIADVVFDELRKNLQRKGARILDPKAPRLIRLLAELFFVDPYAHTTAELLDEMRNRRQQQKLAERRQWSAT